MKVHQPYAYGMHRTQRDSEMTRAPAYLLQRSFEQRAPVDGVHR